MIWYNTVDIGPFQFDIEFIKVNPLTNRLNYATSRVSVNGYVGDIGWYGNKKEMNDQIESAKLINNFLATFDYININEEELTYLFDENGQFEKISHLFSFNDSWSFKRYLESGRFKKRYGYASYIDHRCLLGINPHEIYDLDLDLDQNNDKLSLAYQLWENNSFNKNNKNIPVPNFFSRCLNVAYILSILFDPIYGIVKVDKPVSEWRLRNLITIPSNVGGYFDISYYKRLVRKYDLLSI